VVVLVYVVVGQRFNPDTLATTLWVKGWLVSVVSLNTALHPYHP